MRWLSESERPRRRLRLDEIMLLLLRLLMLALIAALLAVPVLHGEWRDARHWVLADSAIDLDAANSTVSDAKAEWRWLAPGFPGIENERPALRQPTSSLIREFEANLPASDTLTVLVTAEPDGLDAERMALGRAVEWAVVSPASIPDSESVEKVPLKVSLRHASEDQESLRFVRSALEALEVGEPGSWQIDDAPVSAPVDASSKALILLGETLPDDVLPWVEAGGRAIVVDPQAQSGSVALRDSKGDVVARRQSVGKSEVIRFLRPLTPDHLPMLLDAEFPGHLRTLIEGATPAPTQAFAAEAAPRVVDSVAQPPLTPLTSLLCLLVAIVFLIERIVATQRRRTA